MKIVVLDGAALNPGDISWDDLKALGDVTLHERTSPKDLLARAADAEVLITNKVELRAAHFEQLPKLRYIGVTATGYNVIDVDAARQKGIIVTNVPGYSTRSVAQHVFALLLELTSHVGLHSEGVRAGRWAASPDFAYWDKPLVELDGLTLGIVGYGQIGQAVASIGAAFGMEIAVTTRSRIPGVRQLSMDDLFRLSDVVTLHCPLTAETQGLVNAARLRQMKPSAFLINTGRGPLVVEADLAAALNAGQIAGAGLDVLSKEPPLPDNPLLTAKNCIITPHQAWATRAARERLMKITAQNLEAFVAGRRVNVVA